MSSKKQTEVKTLQLTQQQMQAAVKRATENAKTWAVWKDPKATTQGNSSGSK